MSIEAMKQALEALEEACGDRCNAEYNPCHARTAITALRQAIKQAEKQEPVAWIWKYANGEEEVVFVPPRHVDATHVDAPSTITSLYTTPPTVPVLERLEELSSENIRLQNLNKDLEDWVATLKERISYMKAYPQNYEREWFGLTSPERVNIAYEANGDEVFAVQLTEAKLKEKNSAT